MKKFGYSFLLSLLIPFIWGNCFYNIDFIGWKFAAIGYIFTIVLSIFLKLKFNALLDKKVTLTILSVPLAYSILTVIIPTIELLNFINPVILSFLLLIFNLFYLKKNSAFLILSANVLIVVTYLAFVHPYWLKFNYYGQTEMNTQSFEETSHLKNKVPLHEYRFINHRLDTVYIRSEKFVVLETWNETCPPCIAAMINLKAFYTQNNSLFDQYYLYENRKETIRNNFNAIFNYSYISDKSRILIDINQNLYNDLEMNSYPCFLIYDPMGNLLHIEYGYSEEKHTELISTLLSFIKNKG